MEGSLFGNIFLILHNSKVSLYTLLNYWKYISKFIEIKTPLIKVGKQYYLNPFNVKI